MAKGKDIRITVILECTNCPQRRVSKEYIDIFRYFNITQRRGISRYITQKNRHNTPSRLELIKFCSFCGQHMIHAEIKK